MRFIFPPHPSNTSKILPSDLPNYDTGKWLAQFKYNGTHTVIWIKGEDVEIRERHGKIMTTYILSPQMKQLLHGLNHKNKELVLAGELLHTKAKLASTNKQAVDNTIVLFDVLFWDKPLLQLTQVERVNLLSELCDLPKELEEQGRALVVREMKDSKLWLAETFKDDFEYRFFQFLDYDKDGVDLHPEIEGLMLRLVDSQLATCQRNGDCSWLVRCRKPKPNMYQL